MKESCFSAERGRDEAQYALAELYREGDKNVGLKSDEEQYLYWLRLAARNGNSEAEEELDDLEGNEEDDEDSEDDESESVPTKPTSMPSSAKPSPVLAAIIGSSPVSRNDAIKKFWEYVRANGLQDKSNKRIVNADDKLLILFEGKKEANIFEVTKFINNNLSNED